MKLKYKGHIKKTKVESSYKLYH